MNLMLRELVIATPEGATQVVPLTADHYSLGRSATADLSFPDDAGLSRQHLILELRNGDWYLADMGSMNGTYVNEVRLTAKEPRKLQPGDTVLASRLVMQFGLSSSPPPEPPLMPVAAIWLSQLPGMEQKPWLPSYQIALSLAQNEAWPKVFLEQMLAVTGAAAGVISLLKDDALTVQAEQGGTMNVPNAAREAALQDRGSLLLTDGLLIVPLQTSERAFGFLALAQARLPFTTEDLAFVTAAGHLAGLRCERDQQMGGQQEKAAEAARLAEQHRSLLPAASPVVSGLDLASLHLPGATRGAYYDYVGFADGRLGVVVADAPPRDPSSLFYLTALQARVQSIAGQYRNPAEFLARLPAAAHPETPATILFGILEPTTGRMLFSSAGHPAPVLIRGGGAVEALTGGGGVLGIPPYPLQAALLQPGDALLLYTAGVPATRNTGGEAFSADRLAALARDCRHLPAVAMLDQLSQTLLQWAARAETDGALMIVKRV